MNVEFSGIFVLVHGGNMSTDTWNKLSGREDYTPGGHLGARYWDGTIEMLEAHNYRVFAPTLTDEFESSLTGHIDQICRVIEKNNLKMLSWWDTVTVDLS